MKNVIPAFLMLIVTHLSAQQKFLHLPQPLENIKLDSSTVKLAEKQLGKAEKTFNSRSFADIGGGCLVLYLTKCTYSGGYELLFCSRGKDEKKSKKLEEITLTKGNVFVNGSFLRVGASTSQEVYYTVGDSESESINEEKKEFSFSYSMICSQKPVQVEFVFNGEKELDRVIVTNESGN